MKLDRISKQKGFTIIELMIATAVFSVVLLVFMTAFIKISQLFYKGVNMSNTQESARIILQDVSDDVQFNNGNSPVSGPGYFCVGTHRYAYNLHKQVGSSGTYGIAREEVGSICPSTAVKPVPADTSLYDELLSPGMQVNDFVITPCLNDRCVVSLHIVYYGGDDKTVLYSPSGNALGPDAFDAECTGALNSSQYCATADYQSTILQKF